jgi:predicted NAD-dependent protein-ADP-ribosyltransferase YbiA (DUF1768 family)
MIALVSEDMLGFRFCPRLRDFQDRRLVSVVPPSAYPSLAAIMGRKVRTDVVKEHWGVSPGFAAYSRRRPKNRHRREPDAF